MKNFRGKTFHHIDIALTRWMAARGLLFPSEVLQKFPFSLTLEGQYIIKNLVIVGAGIVLGATVRGGRLSSSGEASP